MFAITLADVARRTGFPVVEIQGWRFHTTRDAPNGLMAVRGVVCHHTAGAREGNYPSLDTTVNGRSDLSGPLCNLGLGRDGTIYVIAAGKANHAGAVLDPDFQNGMSIGIEAENVGDGSEPWPDVQMRAFRALCKELMSEYGFDIEHVRGHKEVCSPEGRKIDPSFDMRAFRASIQKEESTVSDFVAGRVWGDIGEVFPTLIARTQRAGREGNFSVSVQDGHRSYADSVRFWNDYQRYLRGGPYAPVAAPPGTSLHCGNPPQYALAVAIDLTVHTPDGGTISPRHSSIRPHFYAAGMHDPVSSEDWHWQAKEDRYPPLEHPDPVIAALKLGSSGAAVKKLQHDLNYVSVKPYTPISEDGSFGPGTKACVLGFQKNMNLTPDGVAGELTLRVLNALLVQRENRYSGQPTVRRGSTGAAVTLVQQFCNMYVPTVIDGAFGPGTEASVKVVQKKWGIAADGIAGPAWWAKADDVLDYIGGAN